MNIYPYSSVDECALLYMLYTFSLFEANSIHIHIITQRRAYIFVWRTGAVTKSKLLFKYKSKYMYVCTIYTTQARTHTHTQAHTDWHTHSHISSAIALTHANRPKIRCVSASVRAKKKLYVCKHEWETKWNVNNGWRHTTAMLHIQIGRPLLWHIVPRARTHTNGHRCSYECVSAVVCVNKYGRRWAHIFRVLHTELIFHRRQKLR